MAARQYAAPASGFRRKASIDSSPETLAATRDAVMRAQSGDPDALRFIYLTYKNNVYGYVRAIVGDDHDAEDVTQHVFAKLIVNIAKFDERGIPFIAWLLRLGRNVAIDHVRANRVVPVESPAASTPQVHAYDADQRQTVRDALGALPFDQREVVVLRHIVGLSAGEIAVRLGRTESSVHGLHHRGRVALRRELERLDCGPSTCHRPHRHLAAAA